MSSVNKVIIVGNLGADPETRQFGNGGSVTHLAVATSERWTDKQSGERRELTEWHRISLFNKLGEVAAKYLHKGSKVYIEGSLRTNKYQDKSGQDRYSTEIRASEMVMLDGVNNTNTGGNVFQNTPNNNQNASPMQGGSQPNTNQNMPQNQGNNTYNNHSNNDNQFKQPTQTPAQPSPTAMSNAPADDDLPF